MIVGETWKGTRRPADGERAVASTWREREPPTKKTQHRQCLCFVAILICVIKHLICGSSPLTSSSSFLEPRNLLQWYTRQLYKMVPQMVASVLCNVFLKTSYVTSSKFPADQIWSQCRINWEIVRRRDVLLHQWEVVYRCNCVKEDVLFRSWNAPH